MSKYDVVITKQTDRLSKEIGYWITNCKLQGLTDQSIQIYTIATNKFYWWCLNEAKLENLEPAAIRPEHISEYVAYLKAPNKARWGITNYESKETLSTASIATYFRCLRIFFNWLEDKGSIDKTPVRHGYKIGSKKNPINNKFDKSLEADDLKKIFDVLTDPNTLKTYNGARNLALISLLLDSGMRRGEIISIQIGNFDWGRNRVSIDGKSGKRVCFFSRSTEQALLDYKDKYRFEQKEYRGDESPFWFTSDGQPLSKPGLDGIISKIRVEAGVNFSAHKLRHTFATLMVQKVSIYDLSKLLGHSSVVVTELYLHNRPDPLQKVYSNNSPLSTLDIGQLKPKSRRGRPPKSKDDRVE